MRTDDERKAAAKAQTFLGALTTTRTDQIAFALRYAAHLATGASTEGFSSDATLNTLRGDAVNALNAVVGSLDAQLLTPDLINHVDARSRHGCQDWKRKAARR